MNAQILRQNYGSKQITLHAMTGRDFKALLNALKYPVKATSKGGLTNETY